MHIETDSANDSFSLIKMALEDTMHVEQKKRLLSRIYHPRQFLATKDGVVIGQLLTKQREQPSRVE